LKPTATGKLQELKHLIQTAYEEHEEISRELATARQEHGKASRRYLSWVKGFLFKRLFKRTFAKRKGDAESASAKVQEEVCGSLDSLF
jgi:hypothetical protein